MLLWVFVEELLSWEQPLSWAFLPSWGLKRKVSLDFVCIEEKGVEVTRELDAAVDEFWFAHNFQVGLEVTDQEPVPDDIRISLDIHFIEQLQSKQLAP